MSSQHTGWLFDLYPNPDGGLAVWLLEDSPPSSDEALDDGRPAKRLLLKQRFPTTFYAAGEQRRLRALWRHLQRQANAPSLSRLERRDLFQTEPLPTLTIQVEHPTHQPRLFSQLSRAFPDLTWYDADIPFTLRHAAVYGTFPLAKVQLTVDEQEWITDLQVLDSPWEIDPSPAPLRVLRIEPDCDPRHASPTALHLHAGRHTYYLQLEPIRPLLVNLAAIIQRHDPDLLLTAWGDTWLLPLLLELSEQASVPLPLNRDERQQPLHKAEHSYQAYGQVIYRGRQVQLFGRWHIDIFNAMMFHDYGMDGILESARVTALPVQQAARLSPGSGISAMQVVTALRQEVLVPWHKQQVERPKTALDLLYADQGGLVYQPIIGLHRDVVELDFISMYPSIMAYFNISPETVGQNHLGAEQVPELALWVNRQQPGLVPQTLQPLLEKRITFKEKIAILPKWDPRRKTYKARASAHKWLLVTCFGYLGYKNARFGRIEAHQAVTAYSRECLLRAKEVSEEAGFNVLHMYVDGFWVQKAGCRSVQDARPLLDEIAERTRLPIALEGIYRWVAFLPSRSHARVPVANRYFGVFQDGSLKVRGIEARRRDTPPFIAQTQMALLEKLAEAPDAAQIPAMLPALLAFLRQQLRRLRARRVPLEELLVTQKLSRELELYRTPSPPARAAAQLARLGKPTRPGQTIRFLFTIGEPGVHAWDTPPPPSPGCLDIARYSELFLRAAVTIMEPMGISSERLRDLLFSNASYPALPGKLPLFSNTLPAIDQRQSREVASRIGC